MQHVENIRKHTKLVLDKFVAEGVAKASDVAAVLADRQEDPESLNARLRGSILRVEADGGPKYFAVPVQGDVAVLGAAPKIHLVNAWGQAAKAKAVTELVREGLSGAVLGVLSTDSGAGLRASLKWNSMPAELRPGPVGPTSKVSVKVAGALAVKPIKTALAELKLSWRPWAGQPGGLAARPEAAGLPKTAEAAAAEVLASDMGTGPRAAMAITALVSLGVMVDGAAGVESTAGELAAFMAGAAGSPDPPPSSSSSSPPPPPAAAASVRLVAAHRWRPSAHATAASSSSATRWSALPSP